MNTKQVSVRPALFSFYVRCRCMHVLTEQKCPGENWENIHEMVKKSHSEHLKLAEKYRMSDELVKGVIFFIQRAWLSWSSDLFVKWSGMSHRAAHSEDHRSFCSFRFLFLSCPSWNYLRFSQAFSQDWMFKKEINWSSYLAQPLPLGWWI